MQITEPSPTSAGTFQITCDKCQHAYLAHQMQPRDPPCHCPVCGSNTEQVKQLAEEQAE